MAVLPVAPLLLTFIIGIPVIPINYYAFLKKIILNK